MHFLKKLNVIILCVNNLSIFFLKKLKKQTLLQFTRERNINKLKYKYERAYYNFMLEKRRRKTPNNNSWCQIQLHSINKL